MDKVRAPRIGHPVADQILILIWPVIVAINWTMTANVAANVCVAAGALLGAILTALKIYERLAGEPLSTTLASSSDE